MAKRSRKIPATIDAGMVLEETRRMFAVLLENHETTRAQLERTFADRFESIDRKFEQIDHRFEQIDRRFEQVDRRFDFVDSCMGSLLKDVSELNVRQGRTEQDIRELKTTVGAIQVQLTDLTLTVKRHDTEIAELQTRQMPRS